MTIKMNNIKKKIKKGVFDIFIAEISSEQKKYLIYIGIGLLLFFLIVMPLLISYGIGKGMSGYAVASEEQTELRYEGLQREEIIVIQEEASEFEIGLPEYKGADSEIQNIIDAAKSDITAMAKEGLSITGVKKLLIEIYDEANNFQPNYNKIVEKANEIVNSKKKAFSTNDLLSRKELEITEFEKLTDIAATKAWFLHEKATGELKNEQYDDAEKTIEKITPLLTELQITDSLWRTLINTQENKLIKWFGNNIATIILILLLISILVYFTAGKVKIFLLRRKIDYLVVEQDLLDDFIKKAEKGYDNKTITRSMYLMKRRMYETRKEDINKEIPLLKERLQQSMKSTSKSAKEDEEKRKYALKEKENKKRMNSNNKKTNKDKSKQITVESNALDNDLNVVQTINKEIKEETNIPEEINKEEIEKIINVQKKLNTQWSKPL